MKYLKTNEEISTFLNKKIISNFDKLIERLDTYYNNQNQKCIKSNAHLFAGIPIKDTVKITTLIMSNDEYKIIITATLIKEGLDKIQRLIAESRIQINIDVSHKKFKDSNVSRYLFTKFDKSSDILDEIVSFF